MKRPLNSEPSLQSPLRKMPVTVKELFRTADSCSGCGDCNIFQGHVCDSAERMVEEHCPNCNKLMLIIHAGAVIYQGDRCDCNDEMCKFCPECCRVLSLFGVVPN